MTFEMRLFGSTVRRQDATDPDGLKLGECNATNSNQIPIATLAQFLLDSSCSHEIWFSARRQETQTSPPPGHKFPTHRVTAPEVERERFMEVSANLRFLREYVWA